MRGYWKRMLCILLTVFLAACGTQPTGLAAQVEVQRLEADTRYLTETFGPRPAGSESERAAADWLAERLRELGFSEENDTLQWQDVDVNGAVSRNLTAVCNPELTGQFLVIVAHYDTVPDAPGARDNGGSVAAALEAARILGPLCEAMPMQVRILFAGAEETGFHGSAAWVQALTEEEKTLCAGAFNMDISVSSDPQAIFVVRTLGGRTENGYVQGDVIEPAHNAVSRAAEQAYQTLYGVTDRDNGTEYRAPRHYGESDQVSFNAAGIDAANLCWRRPDGDFDLLPEEYHRPTDTAENLDFATLEATARCLMLGLELLAAEITP